MRNSSRHKGSLPIFALHWAWAMQAALQLLALCCMLFLLKSQVCKNPAFCWAWNYFKASYCLTTNLAIHSSAGRTLYQLDFEVPLIHMKTHQASKWEKKMPLKNGCLLNSDHLLVWCQVRSWLYTARLCHRTRNFCGSVLKLSDLQAVWHSRHHTTIIPLFLTGRDVLWCNFFDPHMRFESLSISVGF